jgi:type IV pilus assembly protein PilA
MSTTPHPFAPEEVMALVDGELSADRAQSLAVHLDQCAECSTLAVNFRLASSQLIGWQVEIVPERLGRQVAAATFENYSKSGPMRGNEVAHRRSPTLRFAVGIASGIGVVLLVAISVPNLLRSRMAANEASAVGSLRTLNTAAVTYSDTYGHYPRSLENFRAPVSGTPTEDAAGLVDPVLAAGRKSGYVFVYHSVPAVGQISKGSYTINADPSEPSSSGVRHFSTDQTGAIFVDGAELSGATLSVKSQEQNQRVMVEQDMTKLLSEPGPMIARTAELKLVVVKLDDARERMDRILKQHKGYVAQLSVSAESGSVPAVIASLRVPADQLDLCVVELKKLGRVAQESQAGEEVTQQHSDLAARLKNSRNTETRLNDVLQQRGGKITDILEVENESARVRGEIEQMEAEQQTLEHRVEFATIDLKIAEEYKAQLNSPAPSVATQVRNASFNGFRNAFESVLALVLFLAESGPAIMLWVVLLFFPARFLWRRYRRGLTLSSTVGA